LKIAAQKEQQGKFCLENIGQMSINYLTRKKRKTSIFGVGGNKMASFVILGAIGVLSNF
jgi:hypothetical protein